MRPLGGGCRGGAVHVGALPRRAVESATYHQRPRADQRRIPPAREDARQSTEPGCGDAVVVWLAAQWPDQAACISGVSPDGQGDGAVGGVIPRRIDADLLFHHLTDTTVDSVPFPEKNTAMER